jgi:hypothetical protein
MKYALRRAGASDLGKINQEDVTRYIERQEQLINYSFLLKS